MKMRLRARWTICVALGLSATLAWARTTPGGKPVEHVGALRVAVAAGGQLPLYANADWATPDDRLKGAKALLGQLAKLAA